MPTPDIRQQVQHRLAELHQRHRAVAEGSVASVYTSGRGYLPPEHDDVGPDRFAIAVATADGHVQSVGDDQTPFTLQSLSKVFAYGLALQTHGRERVLEHVGVEPSGDAFNSISFEARQKRPFNPMVNAGAIVTSDLAPGEDRADKLGHLLGTLRRYAGNETLTVDTQALQDELGISDRNRAVTYLMRAQSMISGDAEELLTLYLQQCSVAVTCRDVAVMAGTLANGGVNPVTGERALPREYVRDVLSVMYTCGMYDAAGQWAVDVGVPAKSGVSGGLLCVIPGKMGLAVFSPGLDRFGTSVRGVNVCREVSERLGLHLFATAAEDAMLGEPAGTDEQVAAAR